MKKKLTFLALTLILFLSVCTTTIFATNETASLKITAANLSLENAVYMNFKVTHENIDRDDVKLLVWEEMPEAYRKGTEDTCLSAKTDINGTTVFKYTNLAAKDMTKLVYACAYAKIDGVEYYSAPIKYSIAIYAHRMKASSTDAELLELIDAMLEYGALAQKYFNHNTDVLATAPLYQISVNGGKLEDGFAIGWYHEGATATLTANEAEEGYIFSHWENSLGNSVGTNENLTMTVDANDVYTAVYKLSDMPEPEEPTYSYSEGLDYTLSTDKTYYIVSGIGTCEDMKIVIPPTYSEKPVKKIGAAAFSSCTKITSITIPYGITSIGNRAFDNCTRLLNIEIPEDVASIGEYAFDNCTSLTSIKIPKSVISIGDYAFKGCRSLERIEILEGVTSVGNYAFVGCTGLESIKIPKGVISIGDSTFRGCTSLASVEIPKGVISIGDSTFRGCTSLASVEIPEGVTSIGDYMFEGCTSLTSIKIPEGVTSIGNFAFSSCTSLVSIEIPKSVTSIGGSAFWGCMSVTSIELPESITSIGDYAFCGCMSVTSIELPEGVTSIGADVFSVCTSLTSITISESVTSIGAGAFYVCDSLQTVYYRGTAEEWSDIGIGIDNAPLTSATIYYYSQTAPTTEGNFWRYVDGVPTPW